MTRLARLAALLLATSAAAGFAAVSQGPNPPAATAHAGVGVDLAGIDKAARPGDGFDNTPMAAGGRGRRSRPTVRGSAPS
jgi:hypothetical protein